MNGSDVRQTGFPREPSVTLLALALLPLSGVGQDAEIHRCPQADGTIAFQELPCPAEAADGDSRPSEEGHDVEPSPSLEPPGVGDAEAAASAAPRSQTLPSGERAECEKTTRDAIDAIDEEIRKSGTREARETYLAGLLDLTNQLRACKQL